MRIENGTLVMETTKCYGCTPAGSGSVYLRKTCPKCNGTQRGPRGGYNGCKNCLDGTVTDFDRTKEHDRCKGTGIVPETPYDRIDIRDFEFIVIRSNRLQTMNEALLGVGCVVSVTDYGEHQSKTDEELIASVRDHRHGCETQAINIIRDKNDWRVCDAIGIFCNDNGYSVRPIFADQTPDIWRERGYAEGLAVGAIIENAGGNGTLGALYRN